MKFKRIQTGIFGAALGLAVMFTVQAHAIDTESVVDAATGDWNKDGIKDLAIITAGSGDEEDNGVQIFLYSTEENRLALQTTVPNKVWGSFVMSGQQPSIEAAPNGSIIVISGNQSIGRDRWEQKLTIAYRNFDFIVAGYTYSSYDTLDPENTTDCDYNVLTGKGKLNDAPVAAEPKMVTLADWNDDIAQTVCKR